MPILLRTLFIALLALSGTATFAQDAPKDDAATVASAPALTPAQTLVQLRARLDSIKSSVDAKKPDAPLTDLRTSALAVQQQADQLASSLSPQSASLQARLDVLGPAPVKGAPAETSELASQRKQLTRAKNDLDSQITQANSLSTESTQLAAHVSELRRDQFQAQLTSRTATPFSRAFWVDPAKAFADDKARTAQLFGNAGDALAQAWLPPNRTPLILCLIVAVLMMSVVRWLIERTLVQVTTNRMPAGHLRRSALAVTIALAYTLTVGLAAHFVYLAVNWNDTLSPDLDQLARKLVQLVAFAAFMTGLGRAMLSNTRPSWRLTSLSDDAAQRLRLFPWLLGGAAFSLGLMESINNAIGISLSASVATRGFISVLIALLVADALMRLGKSRRATLAAGGEPGQRPVWVGLVVAAAFVCVALVLLGVAAGYIAFAFFIARQMLWVGVILTALYLLMHLVDDIFDTVFAPKGRTGKRLQASFGLQANVLEQIGTVLSGVTRAMLLILAVAIVLAPFGAGPQELTTRVSGLLSGGTLGTLNIVPSDILDALLVFGLGMVILRVIKGWLSDQLLPKTSLDLGMQNSMMTLLGYVGGVLVFVLALVALKVNLQGIAWMASALSVGIGFGLQAIVQNFISGLILLAERPVKVGDWVSIGGVEGDIRRINVRATEIQMGDRSTMIVPNSQFITQNVRNVTLANAQGRVHIVLPMPLDTDASVARELMLEVLNKHTGTLATPEPYVRLDNLDGGTMTFDCIAYVDSPRNVGSVKSDLLFELLDRLRDAKLPMTSPQSMVIRTLPASVGGEENHDDKD
jgi:potassium efflux system protein